MLDDDALDQAAAILAEEALRAIACHGVDLREATVGCKDDLSAFCMGGGVGSSCDLVAHAMDRDQDDLRCLVAEKLEAGFVKGVHSNVA